MQIFIALVLAVVAGLLMQNYADFAETYMDRPLASYDFLISDYNKDLIRWKQANGTGFKYCNGLNNPKSWDGNRLLTTYTSEQIAKLIINSYPVANKTI